MLVSRWGAAVFGAALLINVAPGRAAPYSAEYVFGDSLSDNGNLAEAYGHNFPNPPSYHDSFTNGPVAASLLANSLGLSLTPSLWLTGFQDLAGLFGGSSFVPGTNYAVAGATAAAQAKVGQPPINLPQQVAAFSAFTRGVADANALYVVDIGGNDVRNAALQNSGTGAINAGVQAELLAIQTLAAEGAKNFLVVNVPDIGVIPEFAQENTGLAATATSYSQFYDQLLAAGLSKLTGPSVTQFDLYGYNTALLANAAAFGLTNATDPCYTSAPLSAATTAACGTNAANIGQFVYWDHIHPTAPVQALWASGFETALNVPEPASLAMLGCGLVGLIGLRRRGSGRLS